MGIRRCGGRSSGFQERNVTDIKNSKLLWTKGILFLLIGVVSSVPSTTPIPATDSPG